MVDSGQYISPEEELAAQRGRSREDRLISAEHEAFCTGGRSMVFAVLDPQGLPVAGVAAGVTFSETGQLRLTIPRSRNPHLLAALTQDSRIAVTFSQPRTHRALQVKGGDAMLGKPSDTDIREMTRQTRRLRDDLLDLGHRVEFATSWCGFEPKDLALVSFTPEAIFVQTPGRGAGTRLTP